MWPCLICTVLRHFSLTFSTPGFSSFLAAGLGKLILVWGTTCCSHEWYATHRTALVVANRVVGTSALVAHWVMHPAFYSGGIVKGAVGRGVARLVLSMTHAKLRFAMHTVAIFLELYVCALANAFAFRGSGVAPDGGWGLRTTAVAQLLAAACSTAINYVLERRTRAIFISSRQH